jgi:hypothetical protein
MNENGAALLDSGDYSLYSLYGDVLYINNKIFAGVNRESL